MDHETRRFIREARRETRLLISASATGTPTDSVPDASADSVPGTPVGGPQEEAFDNEIEVIMRSSMGGSANLAFFIPYLWRHRH